MSLLSEQDNQPKDINMIVKFDFDWLCQSEIGFILTNYIV